MHIKGGGFMERLSSLKYIVWVSSLSASLITPIVICVLGAGWLQKKFSLGGWVMGAGIILGLLTAVMNLVKFFKFVQQQAEKSSRED